MTDIVSKVIMITPKLAEEYLRQNNNNRTLDKRRVKFYASQMLKGKWNVLTPDSVSFDEYGRLLDGQHRLEAIIDSGVSVQMLVTTGFAKESFSKINRGKTRTSSDDLSIMNVKNHSVISGGISTYMRLQMSDDDNVSSSYGYDKTLTSSDEIIEKYRSDSFFFDEVGEYATKFYNMNRMKLYRTSEYFAYIAYLVKDKKHSIEKVADFFTQLNSSSNNTSINNLRNKILVDRAQQMSKFERSFKQKLLIKTWNDFVLDKNPRFLVVKPTEEYLLV